LREQLAQHLRCS